MLCYSHKLLNLAHIYLGPLQYIAIVLTQNNLMEQLTGSVPLLSGTQRLENILPEKQTSDMNQSKVSI